MVPGIVTVVKPVLVRLILDVLTAPVPRVTVAPWNVLDRTLLTDELWSVCATEDAAD